MSCPVPVTGLVYFNLSKKIRLDLAEDSLEISSYFL